MDWIDIKDKLPPENRYVIAKHNRDSWFDRDDQDNVNTVIVKMIRGVSIEEREQMNGSEESKVFSSADEDGNNLKPYCFDTFGCDSFFGQSITHWMLIPKLEVREHGH